MAKKKDTNDKDKIRDESIKTIQEKMQELNQTLDDIEKNGGIDINTVEKIERLSPGTVSNVVPVDCYGIRPSRLANGLIKTRIREKIIGFSVRLRTML